MRDISEVIDAILNIVPEDIEKRKEFEERLAWVKEDAAYKAPEAMSGSWGHLTRTMEQFIPVNESDITEKNWKCTALQVINDTEDHRKYLKSPDSEERS